MTGLVLLVAYVLVGAYVGRSFQRRRCGVAGSSEPGAFTAGLVGWTWPVALWMESVRNPQPCSHLRHLRARAVLESRLDQAQQQREREQARRSGDLARAATRPAAPRASAVPTATAAEPTDRTDRRTADRRRRSEQIQEWLTALDTVRPPGQDRLTHELLAVVGPPPLTPRSAPNGAFEFSYDRSRASHLADGKKAYAWLDFGKARDSGDSESMERHLPRAQFWGDVTEWLNQL